MALPTDNTWWPSASSIFDFSLKFEETMLEILPSSCFLFFGSGTYLYYCLQPVYVRDSMLLWLKLASAAVVAALQATSLALGSTHKSYAIDTTYASASLDLVAALGLIAVLFIEHRHAIRSSAFIGLYLFFSVLVQATNSRSYFERDLHVLGGVATSVGAMHLVLLVLEEIPKSKYLVDSKILQASSGESESTAGFWGRTFFCFLLPMFRLGIRGSIQMENLSNIGIEFSSERLLERLTESWADHTHSEAYSLVFACCKAWRGAIIVALVPRFISIGLSFAQPFTMERVITSIQTGTDTRSTKIALVGATALTFFGAPICRTISAQMMCRLLTRIRGGVISKLLQKTISLEISEARKYAAVTLMTADFDGISLGLSFCLDIPFSFIQSGLSIFLLTKFIRQSSFVVIFPLLATTAIGILFGKFLSPAMKKWNEKIQARVSKTSQILSQLQAIKMLGLGPKAVEFIQH